MKRFNTCLVALVLALCSFSARAVTENIYVAQAAAGSDNGTSCVNAHSVSWFNTAANWNTSVSADGKIGPGDQVKLCGTVTSTMTFQGSGTGTNYILLHGNGATMTADFMISGKDFIWIYDVDYSSGYTGTPVTVTGDSDYVGIEDLAIDNFAGQYAIRLDQSGYAGGRPDFIYVWWNNIRTAASNYGDVQHDILVSSGATNVEVKGNLFEMRVVGNTPYSYSHDDIIQTYTKGGANDGPPQDWKIFHNRLIMNTTEDNHRAWCILENLAGTNYIWSNVFLGLDGAASSNGCALYNQAAGTTNHIVGNTFVSKSGANNNVLNLQGSGVMNVKNNILYTGGAQSYTLTATTINRNNNNWYGTNNQCCVDAEVEGDPLFTNYANNDFSLQASSPAENLGLNLGSPFNTYIQSGATWPNPSTGTRPATGAWESGAYER